VEREKMVDIPKNLNSKRFLLTYLVIIGFLLLLWSIQIRLEYEDNREIPIEMLVYLESPPRAAPEIYLDLNDERVLTNDWFQNKWSFVYFSHGKCLPLCQPSLETMKLIQSSFTNNDFQFLVIGLDGDNETQASLASFLAAQQFNFDVASAGSEKVEDLARDFRALFLKTSLSDGRYFIEQEHHIFVLDPKGRIYATFKPPFKINIREDISNMRYFYARSE
jgi:protein SCO1